MTLWAESERSPCSFGEVFTTDGRIQALHLVALQDDRSLFPKYNGSLVVRGQLLADYPQLTQLFAPLSKAPHQRRDLQAHAEVDVDGREPGDVAYDWLKQQGLIRG